MKDLELLYIPRMGEEAEPGDMFGLKRPVNITDRLFDEMVARGVIGHRISEAGKKTWGRWNKHAIHLASGLPLDAFAATEGNWFNRLVVTTGSRESNIRIAAAARAMGWEWEVYEAGFCPLGATWATAAPEERRAMRSEREVFEFVGLPFLKPEERK
jgi:DNA polymerase/3'-5' exonuclease PolX